MTNYAPQKQQSIADVFFTDLPLVTRATTAALNAVTAHGADATGPRLRHFCGDGEPVIVFQPPGPLSWDD